MRISRLSGSSISVIFLLTIFSVALLLTGCKNGESKWEKYTDKEMGFSLNYPDDWYVTNKPLNEGSYQDHLAITNFRPVRSYSDRAPHLNYPNGGISIVLHWQYAPGAFPYKPGPSEVGKRSIDTKALGKRGYVNRMSAQVPTPYLSVKTIINGRSLALELRTDKEGRELGEQIFNKIVKSFKFND